MTTHFRALFADIQFDPAMDHLDRVLSGLRRCQQRDGSILPERTAEARGLLTQMAECATTLNARYMPETVGRAFAEDLAGWLAAGIETRPDFTRYREAIEPPRNGDMVFVLAPYLLANGPKGRGYYFEYFLATREEPAASRTLAALYPHPRNICQSLQVLRGSPGIAEGTSIVFFPENIATPTVPSEQRFAMFFFSKFYRIYHQITAPEVRRMFGTHDLFFGGAGWVAEGLSRADNYAARCVWGYLHDRFHHLGPRPFNENIALKMDWFVGLLEEIKVDAQSALACLDSRVPYGQAVFEFILFERSLRYPLQPDAPTNFDSGTGYFLFSYLLDRGAFRPGTETALTTDLAGVAEALTAMVAEIEALEHLPADQYRAEARALVRRALPAGAGKARYAPPERICRYLGLDPADFAPPTRP